MDLRQLAALLAVGDHQSFSAAAHSLHTVQSNVSTHVAKLEAELGVELVNRRDGTFTEGGELVAARARRIQAELDALVDDLASNTASVTGAVRLGMIGTTARWLVPLVVLEVVRTHPRIDLTIIDATTTSLLPQLLTRRLDLAVVNMPVHSEDVVTESLFVEHLVVVVPRAHPLNAFDEVDPSELSAHRLLLPPRGTAFRDELDAATRKVGVELQAAAEVDGVRLLATLAFEGFGAAILPASAAQRRSSAEWRRIPVSGFTPREVGLATERRALQSRATRAVRSIVTDVARRRAVDFVGLDGKSAIGGAGAGQH